MLRYVHRWKVQYITQHLTARQDGHAHLKYLYTLLTIRYGGHCTIVQRAGDVYCTDLQAMQHEMQHKGCAQVFFKVQLQ